jgi:hypothetical protein
VTAVRIHVLDTTLSEMALSFNTRIAPGDRLRILQKLEELMPDYIEVDAEVYLALGGYEPREARLSVFARREEDVPDGAGVVSFSTDFMLPHKEPAIGQIRHMVNEGRTVFLMAENFFDAFGCNRSTRSMDCSRLARRVRWRSSWTTRGEAFCPRASLRSAAP